MSPQQQKFVVLPSSERDACGPLAQFVKTVPQRCHIYSTSALSLPPSGGAPTSLQEIARWMSTTTQPTSVAPGNFHRALRATIKCSIIPALQYPAHQALPCWLSSIEAIMTHIISASEEARLAALHALEVLDTPAEARFDRFTRLAAKCFEVPIALVSLVDENRQWFKSRCGLDVEQTARSIAFCSHAVELGDMLVVEDAVADPRFSDNPLVTGAPNIRFYAGQPVFSQGEAVGTLCVIDRIPRTFTDEERRCLLDLAQLVEAELLHAKAEAARLLAEHSVKALNQELEQRVTARTTELECKVTELTNEIGLRKAAEQALRQTEAWNRAIVASSYSAFVAADQDGQIIEWNDSAERIFGWTRMDAVGRQLSDLIVPPNFRTAHERGMKRYLEAGGGPALNRKIEQPALTASGRQITVEMTISTYQWQGMGCFGAFLNDISERIQTQQQLEEKQELLDAVLESIDVAVVACDAVGNLTLFNRSARTIHGLNPSSTAPAEWSNYYSLYHANGLTPLDMNEVPLVRVLRGETVRDEAVVIAPRERKPHTVLASGRPLRGASGRMLGAVVALKDITELNASREQLEASERKLRAVTENLPAMMGKVNAAGKFVLLNRHALEAFGKSSEELIGHEIERAYNAEDFSKIRPYIDRVKSGERVFFEHVAHSKGRELYYQCCFVPQRLQSGKPDGFFAMSFDITDRRLSEMRQAESEERLRTITDNVPVLIAQLDGKRRYTFANAVHLSWLGKEPQAVLGQTMEEAFGPEYYDQQRDAIEGAWCGNASQCEHEIVRNKRTRIVHSMFLPQVRNGDVVGVYVLTTDATASRLHERNLHALAHTDTLTELPNRRHFENALNAATEKAASSDRYTALLYLDVDYFKQINDRYGHSMGDAVLVEFANRVRAAVSSSDLVARLAGDEFTVLLSDVRGLLDVELIAEKILASVREPFALLGQTLSVTTTIGAALGNRFTLTPGELVEAADNALYCAKEAGRDTYSTNSLAACTARL
jgi:diguanylate cyclase (GGDEF)-like protein/PAS domain S-box-containing protein